MMNSDQEKQNIKKLKGRGTRIENGEVNGAEDSREFTKRGK